MEVSHRVFLGYDKREQTAYDVACRSLRCVTPDAVVTPLCLDRLAAGGLLRRPVDNRGGMYDLTSNAPQSTEFAVSRFLVGHLGQTGWVLFTDCDVVFLSDIAGLFEQADPDKAVMVVKHPPYGQDGMKMDGQAQQGYRRKGWSSVMLWNCDHPANERLTLQDINERPGRWLHGFGWLADSEIGSLTPDWNWLVGVQEKPLFPRLAHYTLGTPDMVNGGPHEDLWWSVLDEGH